MYVMYIHIYQGVVNAQNFLDLINKLNIDKSLGMDSVHLKVLKKHC